MNSYENQIPNGGHFEAPAIQIANQACLSCKKQKRKCDKALPACALCNRMNRACDYSDATPPPTSDDFNALKMKVMQLEATLHGRHSQPTSYTPSSSSGLAVAESIGHQIPAYNPTQDISWQGVQNRFPAIAFLDSDTFKYGGVVVPKPLVEIPGDVLQLLGDGPEIQDIITKYFETVHKWMPIVSHKRMTRNMVNPMWEGGPDLALLFLCMKLITSTPPDGIEASQSPLYISAKRFIALLEATGSASLHVLQAGLLVTWYEYGQAIYPAAYMSAGWCVRYGNMLGINGNSEAAEILGRTGTWVEQEERRRTWWGVLLADRIVCIGSQGYIPNPQEPTPEDVLPVHDYAWEAGEVTSAGQRTVGMPIDVAVDPFPRLCQAYSTMGAVISHHHGKKLPDEKDQFMAATQLYSEISNLILKLTEESTNDPLGLASPLAVAYSTLCMLCKRYSCPSTRNCAPPSTQAASEMQTQAIEGLRSVSASIKEFAGHIADVTPQPLDLDRVSPIIMDALYSAASNYAWMVRESGDETCQNALDSLRNTMRRLGVRWRSAAEYLRILEAQEFTYAVGSAGS
ncbi:hypothetical protein BKA61DRAFT_611180 [Leptodontidium sp. MPI-SDFR-AT-0119]|nr:hypothetical protein BKA61DRAFT_611180 [Leptodontidium sp. MPI-SDFR-AT-0119]